MFYKALSSLENSPTLQNEIKELMEFFVEKQYKIFLEYKDEFKKNVHEVEESKSPVHVEEDITPAIDSEIVPMTSEERRSCKKIIRKLM